MKHLVVYQEMLEQLKKDHPLPATVKFSCEFQPGPRATLPHSRNFGNGLASVFGRRLPVQIGKIAVSLGCGKAATVEGALRILAHECRHMLQAFVLNTYTRKANPLCKTEYDANEFAKNYVKEYMTRKGLK